MKFELISQSNVLECRAESALNGCIFWFIVVCCFDRYFVNFPQHTNEGCKGKTGNVTFSRFWDYALFVYLWSLSSFCKHTETVGQLEAVKNRNGKTPLLQKNRECPSLATQEQGMSLTTCNARTGNVHLQLKNREYQSTNEHLGLENHSWGRMSKAFAQFSAFVSTGSLVLIPENLVVSRVR